MRTEILLEEAQTRYFAALETETLGQKFSIFPEIDSTNAYLLSLPEKDAENRLCVSLVQTAGRGRLGRSWASEGGGLYFSFCVRAQTQEMLLLLPLAAANAVCDAFAEAGIADAGIKWPNDIILSGKKLVGILCQSRGTRAVAGIGVNISQSAEDFARADLPNAASLAMLGYFPDRWALCARIASHAERYVAQILHGQEEALLASYRARCISIGRELIATSAKGEIRGVGADIDEKGRLILETGKGRVAVDSGEVKLRAANGYI